MEHEMQVNKCVFCCEAMVEGGERDGSGLLSQGGRYFNGGGTEYNFVVIKVQYTSDSKPLCTLSAPLGLFSVDCGFGWGGAFFVLWDAKASCAGGELFWVLRRVSWHQ